MGMFDLLVSCFRSDDPEEIPYRVEHEPGGMLENNDGSWSVYTLKKSYGYWGNILKVEIEENRTRL